MNLEKNQYNSMQREYVLNLMIYQFMRGLSLEEQKILHHELEII